MRYVARGTDTSVLSQIKGLGSAAMAVFAAQHGYTSEEYNSFRRRALVDAQAWRPAVLHRFAVLIETLQDAAGWHRYGKVDPKAPSWLRVLIEEMNRVTHSGYSPVAELSVKPFYSMQRLDELLAVAGEPKAALLHHLYGPKNYATDRLSQLMDGLADYLVENADLVAATLPRAPLC